MSKLRLFNLVIAIALVILIAMTVREAVAITALRSEADAVIRCDSLPSRHSFHTEYVKEAEMWVLYTEDGPAGVDGGLKELMSTYRTCSR